MHQEWIILLNNEKYLAAIKMVMFGYYCYINVCGIMMAKHYYYYEYIANILNCLCVLLSHT